MLNVIRNFGTSKAQEDEPRESTPLLEDEEAQAMNKEVVYDSVVIDDEDSAAVPIMGDSSHLDTIAPPPAAAPPPPPSSNDPQSTDKKKDRKRSSSSNNSLSGLSTTQSTKSGKSGKSSSTRRRKKKNANNNNNKATKKKKPDGPQKSICHLLFDSVRYLAIIASSMMLLMQLVPLYILKSESTWLQIAVRSYLAIFCLFFILTESNIPILRDLLSKFAHSNWILRGFLYSFIGLIGIEQNLAIKVADIAAGTSVLGPTYGTLFASLFMDITTWTMISVGILYFVLGLLCMQQWYEKLGKNHNQKVREYKQKKKREADFKKQQEEYKKYEKDRFEGRAEWYSDI